MDKENDGVEAIEIAIELLPHCYMKERFMELCKDGTAKIIIIAKDGMIGDWSAYHGWPTIEEIKNEFVDDNTTYYCEYVHDLQGVISWGDKLDLSVAKILFPHRDATWYRS